MKRYNRDKRATYGARTRAQARMQDTHDTRERRNPYKRIHIRVIYDGYNHTEYVPIIYGKTRDTRAQAYVNTVNAINDIFPDINAPHATHVYRAITPYHKYIPQATTYTAPEGMMDAHTYKYAPKIERKKCIIYGTQDKIIYMGILRRKIETQDDDVHITLYRGDRMIRVKPYIPRTETIHGVTIQEIYKHDVEFYQI